MDLRKGMNIRVWIVAKLRSAQRRRMSLNWLCDVLIGGVDDRFKSVRPLRGG
jgi:hypothetical protein